MYTTSSMFDENGSSSCVTRITSIILYVLHREAGMKDEYLIPGPGLERVAKIEYFWSEIE